MGHRLHTFLHGLRFQGHPLDGPRLRSAKNQSIRRTGSRGIPRRCHGLARRCPRHHPPPFGQVPAGVAMVPQPTGAGSSLQCRRPRPLSCAEQQEPPQALPTLGRTVRCRGNTTSRCLQIENHQRQGLHQCLEHRIATPFLPLNKRILFLISLCLYKTPTFSDDRPLQNHKGSNLTRGRI